MDQSPNPMAELSDAEVDQRARHHFEEMVGAEGRALLHAKSAGDYLRERKRRLGHGQWLRWLKANYHRSEDTAQDCMQISEHWRLVEPRLGDNPTLSRAAALVLIATVRRPRLRAPGLRGSGPSRRPPVWTTDGKVVYGPLGPLSGDETVDAISADARLDTARAVSKAIRAWSPETAFLTARGGPAWNALDELLNRFDQELKAVGTVLSLVLRRLHRIDRGEYQFGHDLESEGGRPLPEREFDLDLEYAVSRIVSPPSPLQQQVVAEFLTTPIAARLRPVEVELLTNLARPPADEGDRERARSHALADIEERLDEWVEMTAASGARSLVSEYKARLSELADAELTEIANGPAHQYWSDLAEVLKPLHWGQGGIDFVPRTRATTAPASSSATLDHHLTTVPGDGS